MNDEVYVDEHAFEMVEKRKKYQKILYICLAFLIFGYLASNYIIIQDRTPGINDTSSMSAGLMYGRIKINNGPMYDVSVRHIGTLIEGKITICYVKELAGDVNISELSDDNIIKTVVIDESGDYDITVKLGDLPDENIYRYMEVSSDFEGSSMTVKRYISRPLMQIIINIIMTNIIRTNIFLFVGIIIAYIAFILGGAIVGKSKKGENNGKSKEA